MCALNLVKKWVVAGKDYIVLDKEVETETGSQVEVREIFRILYTLFSVQPLIDN